MSGLLRGLLDLAFPPGCGGCGAPVEGAAALCRGCDRSLARIPAGLCTLCQAAPAPARGRRCAACTGRRGPLAACVAAAEFAGEVEAWIHRFKYPAPGIAGLDPAALAVARGLVREAARIAAGGPPQLVVPIPLHPRRLRVRGFNPAAILARSLARELRAPFDPVALRRVRDTPSQTGLDRRERRHNVRGAFRTAERARLPGRVWLVDDVVTTGSTLTEAARVLRRAGARTVVAVCAARTPDPR